MASFSTMFTFQARFSGVVCLAFEPVRLIKARTRIENVCHSSLLSEPQVGKDRLCFMDALPRLERPDWAELKSSSSSLLLPFGGIVACVLARTSCHGS